MKKYSITSNLNPINVSVASSSSFQVRGISIDRFEWYPPTTYSSQIPQLSITTDFVEGTFNNTGYDSRLCFTVMRNQDMAYKRVRKVQDDILNCGDQANSITFSFVDVNGNLVTMGGGPPSGVSIDPNATNYLFEFTLWGY